MGSYGYHVVGFDGTKNAVEKAKRELAARLPDHMDDKPDAEDDEIYYCGTGYGYVTEETSSILKRLPKSGLTEIRYHYRDGDGEASGAERWRPQDLTANS